MGMPCLPRGKSGRESVGSMGNLPRIGLMGDHERGGVTVNYVLRHDGDVDGLAKIMVDDGSFSFDYAHFLPEIEKCATLHGHSASVLVEVYGRLVGGGLVVDFGILKRAVREVISSLDHKIIVCERYVESSSDGYVHVRFSGLGGEYSIQAPATYVFVAPFESTAENIAGYICGAVLDRMPLNVEAVRVVVSEGVGKFAERTARRV